MNPFPRLQTILLMLIATNAAVGRALGADRPTAGSFDANGVKIAYFVQGEGEPVVLIHGEARARRGGDPFDPRSRHRHGPCERRPDQEALCRASAVTPPRLAGPRDPRRRSHHVHRQAGIYTRNGGVAGSERDTTKT